jgi:hypothetical protein
VAAGVVVDGVVEYAEHRRSVGDGQPTIRQSWLGFRPTVETADDLTPYSQAILRIQCLVHWLGQREMQGWCRTGAPATATCFFVVSA